MTGTLLVLFPIIITDCTHRQKNRPHVFVETMGLFTSQALKASHGEEDTLRFFALISSLFAIKERATIVPGTPDNYYDIIKELEMLESKHYYLGMLSAIRVAVDHLDEKISSQKGYYILILNYLTRRLQLKF